MTFLNVVEIESALMGLATAYPSFCELIALPHMTYGGKRSHALKIGKVRDCPKPAVLIISGAHAREWGGPDICINFAADMLEAYSMGTGLVYGGMSYSAEEIGRIVNRVDVIVFPNINPDGREYSQTPAPAGFAMWRKNRNPESSGGDPAKIGVDVNRNYDFLWDFGTAFHPSAQAGGTLASTFPGSDLFHGKSAFSEAESLNVCWLFDRFTQISLFMDIHSYGGDILYAWGDDANQAVDPGQNFKNAAWNGKRGLDDGGTYREFISLCDWARMASLGNAVKTAIATVRGQSYPVAQAFYLPSWGSPYPTSGASSDWAFSRYFSDPRLKKVRAYAMEFNLTKTFFPTWDEMVPIIKDVDAGLVRFCLAAAPNRLLDTVGWWCRLGDLINQTIWHKVFPPELWGPYGPWGRLRNTLESAFHRIASPVIRRIKGL